MKPLRPYAHSLSDKPRSDWEPLHDHLRDVAATCAAFAATFGWASLGRAAGLLHDIGKCSAEFQGYISLIGADRVARGPDHSSAGAREAVRLYGPKLGRLLAFVVAGHHAGLADGDDLERRLTKAPPAYDGWQAETGPLPTGATLAPTLPPRLHEEHGFTHGFLTRFLFSCLVDADRLETAAFYARAGAADAETPLPVLRDRLRCYMAAKGGALALAETDTRVHLATLRHRVLKSAIAKSRLAPGLFTLTVPTGGGKTLASLSFALEHAVTHDLRRIVYVIPFTSIIEQTAGVFRSALGASSERPNDRDVVEHHASYDWDEAFKVALGRPRPARSHPLEAADPPGRRPCPCPEADPVSVLPAQRGRR